jgi:hypothetical protein
VRVDLTFRTGKKVSTATIRSKRVDQSLVP